MYNTSTCTLFIVHIYMYIQYVSKKTLHTVSFNHQLNGLSVEKKNGRAMVESAQRIALTSFKMRTRRGVKTGSSGITSSFFAAVRTRGQSQFMSLRKALREAQESSVKNVIFTCVTTP